jgi:hypothetical protein
LWIYADLYIQYVYPYSSIESNTYLSRTSHWSSRIRSMATAFEWMDLYFRHLGIEDRIAMEPLSYATGWSGGGAADQAMDLLFRDRCVLAWGCQADASVRAYYANNFNPCSMYAAADHITQSPSGDGMDTRVEMFIAAAPRPPMMSFHDTLPEFDNYIRASRASRSLILQTSVRARQKHKCVAGAPLWWQAHIEAFPCPLDYMYHIIEKYHPLKNIIDLDIASKNYGLPVVKNRLFILACGCDKESLDKTRQAIHSLSSVHSRIDMMDIHERVRNSGLERLPHPALCQVHW